MRSWVVPALEPCQLDMGIFLTPRALQMSLGKW